MDSLIKLSLTQTSANVLFTLPIHSRSERVCPSKNGWVIFAVELSPHDPSPCVQPWRYTPRSVHGRLSLAFCCCVSGLLSLPLAITLTPKSQASLFRPYCSSSLRHRRQGQGGRKGILAPEAGTSIICHSDSSLSKHQFSLECIFENSKSAKFAESRFSISFSIPWKGNSMKRKFSIPWKGNSCWFKMMVCIQVTAMFLRSQQRMMPLP